MIIHGMEQQKWNEEETEFSMYVEFKDTRKEIEAPFVSVPCQNGVYTQVIADNNEGNDIWISEIEEQQLINYVKQHRTI